MKISVQGDKAVRLSLKRYAAATNKTLRQAVLEHAWTVTRSLVVETQPYGVKGASKKAGVESVKRDTRRAYNCFARMAAKLGRRSRMREAVFLEYVKSGQYDKANELIRSVAGWPTEVSASPDPQVKRSGRRKGVYPRGSLQQIVERCQATTRIATESAKRVGAAKAGWVAAYGDINPAQLRKKRLAGIPVWIRRNASQDKGSGRMSLKRDGGTVWLTNRVKYASAVIRKSRVKKALRIGMTRSVKRMRAALRQQARKERLAQA